MKPSKLIEYSALLLPRQNLAYLKMAALDIFCTLSILTVAAILNRVGSKKSTLVSEGSLLDILLKPNVHRHGVKNVIAVGGGQSKSFNQYWFGSATASCYCCCLQTTGIRLNKF